MRDIRTATGTTVPVAALEQLLIIEDCGSGVRGAAHTTVSDRARAGFATAYYLSGGGELDGDAHDAGVTNLLHHAVPGIVAFALHHLHPLLPDLTDEQWARVDAAAVALDSRVCENLSGADWDGHDEAAQQQPE